MPSKLRLRCSSIPMAGAYSLRKKAPMQWTFGGGPHQVSGRRLCGCRGGGDAGTECLAYRCAEAKHQSADRSAAVKTGYQQIEAGRLKRSSDMERRSLAGR